MSADVAVVLVHYHAGPLLAEAIRALRDDLAASGLEAELVVVDNGSSDDERRRMEALRARRIELPGNPGYAAGLNRGARATGAERIVFMNPDVLPAAGCLAALLSGLEHAGAVGPRLYWDRGLRCVLPPTERRGRWQELVRVRAGRSEARARAARRRWRRHARRHWLARRPLASFDLSGALLAVRRDALAAVGPFDERYRLYFEENDWLRRLARSGGKALYLPQARAVHLYNQSAARQPEASAWFAASSERFAERHYGRRYARWLRRLSTPPAAGLRDGWQPIVEPRLAPPRGRRRPRWVEISPSPLGFPAAGEPVDGDGAWSLAAGVWETLAPGDYFLTTCDRAGRELARHRFHRPAEQESG